MRQIKAVALACATLCACAAILLQASAGASAAIRRTPFTYDPATQSHPGACSQNTSNVAQAVGDLNANGVLGQYAALVGVHATGSALTAEMKQTLMVLNVLKTTVTANHGCTTDGLIFATGSRTLSAGEPIGVALPASIRAKLCRGSTAGCEREVLTEHTVFPTNCWNLDQGSVQVAVYLHKPKVKPRPKPKPKPKPRPKPKPKPVTKAKVVLPAPSASVATACGTGNSGTSTVTLSNGAHATAPAEFVVNGKSYGPLAAGQSTAVSVALASGGPTGITVTSDGDVLVSQQVPADPCPVAPPAPPVPPAPPTPKAAPSATATFSCSAGGVTVTLSNAASATASAMFEVNGTSYGPIAPGGSQTATVTITPGSLGTVTVTSGSTTLLNGAAYTNSCSSTPSAFVSSACSQLDPIGGGTIAVQLVNGTSASLPATFTVTAVGNTTSGFGPASEGPIAPGTSRTVLLSIDGSGNSGTVTVSSGSYSETFPFTGCPARQEE